MKCLPFANVSCLNLVLIYNNFACAKILLDYNIMSVDVGGCLNERIRDSNVINIYVINNILSDMYAIKSFLIHTTNGSRIRFFFVKYYKVFAFVLIKYVVFF